MKRANRQIKVIIMICTKKNLFGQFWAQNSGSALIIFLKFCRMKGSNRYRKSQLFFEKKQIWGNLIFLGQLLLFIMVEIEPDRSYYWMLKHSGYYFFYDYYRILKHSGHDQDPQGLISQVNIYVIDMVWILCDVYVWRS